MYQKNSQFYPSEITFLPYCTLKKFLCDSNFIHISDIHSSNIYQNWCGRIVHLLIYLDEKSEIKPFFPTNNLGPIGPKKPYTKINGRDSKIGGL